MAVIRINKNKNFTVMSNYHFREKEMSLKAKGLLSLMLSLPDEWDYSISGLVAISKENESAIKSTLNELKSFGYLTITKKLPNETDTGRIEYEYNIYEQPQEKQEVEKQGVENLPVEIQPVENPVQLNTNTLTTNELSTNKANNILSYSEIIDYLNEKAGTKYRATTGKTQSLIQARLKENFTIEDFKTVIDNQCAKWLNDNKMRDFIRPETLFGTKFESYLNAKVTDTATPYNKPQSDNQRFMAELQRLYNESEV